MAKNYIEDGQTMDWTNTTGAPVKSGDPVAVASITGVAHGDIPDNGNGVLHMTGVFSLPKKATDSWQAGNLVYLSEGELTSTSGDVVVGLAWADAAVSETEAAVRLGA
jgi:predicted RecA/RadA family phage recombinase